MDCKLRNVTGIRIIDTTTGKVVVESDYTKGSTAINNKTIDNILELDIPVYTDEQIEELKQNGIIGTLEGVPVEVK